MKPIDDMLPEEESKQYEPLLTLLSRASRKPTPLTSDEQAQSIARVQQRLGLVEDDASQDEASQSAGIAAQQIAPLRIPPQQPAIEAKSPRRTRMLRFINAFAAILFIGAIIGVSLLLFRHQPQSTGSNSSQAVSTPVVIVGPPIGQGGTPDMVSVRASGLEAILRITPGPYFLSELLAADISLTNHSHTTYQLQGVPTSNPCDAALGINYTPTGANTTHYPFPMYGAMSCPFTMSQFNPGQSIAIRQYIPLTDSGRILLTEEATFLVTKTTPNQGRSITNGPSSLDGHWPALHINVASRVPSNRIISLHRLGSKVFINAPVAVRSQLLYLYTISCSDFHDAGSTASGNYDWTPVTTTIGEPGCPGQKLHWTYAVSAPGYAIVSGSYTSP